MRQLRVMKEIWIHRCYRSCPFYVFEQETGTRCCDHPKAAKHGFIIPPDIQSIDFPPLCPLLRENGGHTNITEKR